MIGIDTNVLVSYLVRDDETQYERARRRIEREADTEGVLISLLVLLEIEWVLRCRYQFPKADIIGPFPHSWRPPPSPSKTKQRSRKAFISGRILPRTSPIA